MKASIFVSSTVEETERIVERVAAFGITAHYLYGIYNLVLPVTFTHAAALRRVIIDGVHSNSDTLSRSISLIHLEDDSDFISGKATIGNRATILIAADGNRGAKIQELIRMKGDNTVTVVSVALITGYYDLLVEVVGNNFDSIKNWRSHIQSIRGVDRTETLLYEAVHAMR